MQSKYSNKGAFLCFFVKNNQGYAATAPSEPALTTGKFYAKNAAFVTKKIIAENFAMIHVSVSLLRQLFPISSVTKKKIFPYE